MKISLEIDEHLNDFFLTKSLFIGKKHFKNVSTTKSVCNTKTKTRRVDQWYADMARLPLRKYYSTRVCECVCVCMRRGKRRPTVLYYMYCTRNAMRCGCLGKVKRKRKLDEEE